MWPEEIVRRGPGSDDLHLHRSTSTPGVSGGPIWGSAPTIQASSQGAEALVRRGSGEIMAALPTSLDNGIRAPGRMLRAVVRALVAALRRR
jgi:hypothetical protein